MPNVRVYNPWLQVFYEHEGQYQRERSGMYKTSYDPYILQHSMNKREVSANHLFNISDSHVDALNLPTELNQEMAEAVRYVCTYRVQMYLRCTYNLKVMLVWHTARK